MSSGNQNVPHTSRERILRRIRGANERAGALSQPMYDSFLTQPEPWLRVTVHANGVLRWVSTGRRRPWPGFAATLLPIAIGW